MKKCIKKNMVMKIIQSRNIKVLIAFSFFYFLVYLSFAQQIDWSLTHKYSEKDLKNMEKRIIDGDTLAFFNYIFYAKHSTESLPYALYMANKFNYPLSYYYVYELSLLTFQKCGIIIDSTSYLFAFSYLLKGSELGCIPCTENIAEIYYIGNRYIERDTLKAKKYLTKGINDEIIKSKQWNSFKELYQKSIQRKDERF